LPYSLEIEERCKRKLAKAGARNPELRKAVEGKLAEILDNPYRFKPLRPPLQNKYRVHIMKSFVMIFDVAEGSKTVRILGFDHHDKVYK